MQTPKFLGAADHCSKKQRDGSAKSLRIFSRVSLVVQNNILAHDFGGATILRGYFLNGLEYGSLTIFDAVALAPWGSPFVQHVRKYEAAFSGMPAYMHEALIKSYLQTAAFQPLSDEILDIYATPWLGEVGQPAFYRQIAQMSQKYTDDVEVLYTRMSCPVTVLWGEEDRWIPVNKGRQLANLISNKSCIPIKNAGRLVQEDSPETIVAIMVGQITEH